MSLWDSSALSLPQLAPLLSPAELEVRLAAIEYSLANPITIRSKEDILSHKHWSEHLTPYEHQVRNLITFCRRAPVALIADDVGLGKTISAGLIVSELMTRKKVRRILILCPKLLLPQWCEELSSKFGIKAVEATGNEVLRLASTQIPAIVTTYDTARSRLKALGESNFDMIIIDEAHKLRNLYGQNEPPKMATAIRSALASDQFRYALLLTATPIQNRLWDIYSLIDCLSAARRHANPLGNPDQFADRFLQDGKTTARVIHPGRVEEFRRRISEYMVRTSRRDSNLVFPVRKIILHSCPKTEVDKRLEKIVGAALEGMNPLARISVAQAHMSSPAALAHQLNNMAERGSFPKTVADAVDAIAAQAPTGNKVSILVSLATELRGSSPEKWRMVVFTQRKVTQECIGSAMLKAGVKVGFIRGGEAAANQRAIKGFWNDPPDIHVLVSTDAGAEGINLQICNVLVNYDLPWNPMIVEQRIGRVQRLASTHSTVEVVNLVVKDSVEETVVERLVHKLAAISTTIGDLEGILEASTDGSLEDIEDSLKDLVVRALMGQDVKKATEKLQSSIDRARQIYEAEKETVERNLGELGAMHDAGPTLPDLAPTKPRLTVEEFVEESFKQEEAIVEPAGEQRPKIRRPGYPPFFAVFDDRDPLILDAGIRGFGGRNAELFAEGTPAFERQVGSWSKRHGHHIQDATKVSPETISAIAADWIAHAVPGGSLESHTVATTKPEFQGRAWIRASASVAHDRYEKLVCLQMGNLPDAEESAARESADGTNIVSTVVAPSEFIGNCRETIPAAVEHDSDIAAFCQFYRARKIEEMQKAKASSEQAAQIERNFEPYLTAEVVGLHGTLGTTATVDLAFRIGAASAYEARIVIDPRSRTVVEEPAADLCSVTGISFPLTCLDTCSISKQRALRHLMVESEATKRRALPQFAVQCAESVATLLKDETQVSAVSGQRVDQRLLVECAISHQKALPRELAVCEFTDAHIMPELATTSLVSGKTMRRDQSATSAVSGISGHRNEFVRCELTGGLILPSEAGISSVSGRKACHNLLVSSDSGKGRVGFPEEIVACQMTGKQLLKDEVETSTLSGIVADRALFGRSEESGANALLTELRTCEETGRALLPDEIGVCEVTDKAISKRLLGKSQVSGKTVRATRLRACKETGALALPEEMVQCEVSGAIVVPEATEISSVSGKHVLRRLAVKCEECGEPMLPSEVERAGNGAAAHPEHLTFCRWTGKKFLSSRIGKCSATGVPLSSRTLSEAGLSTVHQELITAVTQGEPAAERELAAVRKALQLRSIHPSRVWTRRSEHTGLIAAVVEWKELLGLRRRLAICFIEPSGRVIGKVAKGTIRNGHWSR